MRIARKLFWLTLTLAVAASLPSNARVAAQAANDPVINAKGFVTGRDYYSPLPFEHIDSATGSLMLSFTDCELPGNAGWTLAFTRTYNSTTNSWSFGIAGLPLTMAYPTAQQENGAPGGWNLPTFFTADGGEHIARWAQLSHTGTIFMTKEFWKYDSETRKLSLPNGIVADYHEQSPNSARLAGATDAFDNHVAVLYDADGKLERVAQVLPPHGERNVTFTYDASSGGLPKTMTCAGNTWTYTYNNDEPVRRLISVTRPEPPSWSYGYTGVELTSVTTPHGGIVAYEFQNHEFEHDAEPEFWPLVITTSKRVMKTRTIGGDSWTFEFGAKTDLQFTIKGPAKHIVYESDYDDEGQIVPRTRTTKTTQGAGVETETLHSTRRILYGYRSGGSSLDARLSVPTKRIVVRDGQTYTTDYGYRLDSEDYADYGHPNTIAESGQLGRTTSVIYKHDFGPYIRARVQSISTTVTGEPAYGQSFTYDANGFRTSHTRFGIATTLTPTGEGNVATATDARGKVTSYTYEWGVLKNTITPKYTITRGINYTGTVASESRPDGGTTFTYDNLNRVRLQSPSVGDPIDTSYASDGGWTTVARGPSFVTTYLDGFGRPVETVNAGGVRTKISYNSEGQKAYESYPFDGSTAEQGDILEYDEMGHLRKVTHAGGSFITYNYSNSDLFITDEIGHTTRHWREAFGDPDEARLNKLTDADDKVWDYSYDAIGNLTRVDGPEGAARTWTYDAGSHRMLSETHPESGTTTFVYNAVGNLETRTDASGRVFTYIYDDNNRVTDINGPHTEYDVHLGYNSFDQRTRVKNGVIDRTMTYEGGSRLKTRIDTITRLDNSVHVFSTGFEYDGRDNLEEVLYPNGREVAYRYDSANRVTTVEDRGGQIFAQAIAYHPSGAVKSFTFGNGQVESITYDNRGRPDQYSSGQYVGLNYDHDDAGNVTRIADARGDSHSQDFWYDALDRLTSVGRMGAETFTYDAQGNRKTRSGYGLTYWYAAGTNRLESVTGNQASSEVGSYGYDPVGNLTSHSSSGGPRTFTYSASNMMETATVGGVTTTYWYDADNMRARKRVGTSDAQYFVQGPGGNLLSEYTDTAGAMTWQRDYVYLGSRLLASITAPPPVPPCTPDTVTVQGPSWVKAGASAQFTIGLPAALTHAVTVTYQPGGGDAVNGQDYTGANGTLTFAVGETSKIINVQTVFEAEKDETFVFSVGGTCVVPASAAPMTIRNRPKGDLNGDGKPEIVWQNISTGNVAVWLMNGMTLTQAVPITHPPEWEVVAMGDFNHDGYQDFVEQHTSTGAGRVQPMQDLQPLPPLTLPAGWTTSWKVRGVGDFNGDQHDDIVLHHTNGLIAVWRMNGTTLVETGTTTPNTVSATTWTLAGVGDVNGGGQNDLIWQANTNGYLAAWLMSGVVQQSTVNLSPSSEPDTNWKIKGTADYNGDGQPDLLWHHQTIGDTVFWLMNGTTRAGSWYVAAISPTTYRLVGPR